MRTVRLLVVEDAPAFLYLIEQAFSTRNGQFQWDLITASDGEKALQLLLAEEEENGPLPDFILLDWNLPKVTGAEVLRRVKEHPRLRRIPVLVFSSSEEPEDIHGAYDNHANGYITKPSGGKQLAAIVEAIENFWVAIAQLPKVARR